MPGEISAHLRHAQMAGAGIVLILALAILGFVWISIWAIGLMAIWLGPDWAPLAVGLLCLLPLAVFLILKKAKAQKEQERALAQALHHPELSQIAQIAQGLIEKSPLTALAVAGLAGVLAARFPSALTLLLQVLSPSQRT